jgi:hypothetical protein
MGIRWDHLAKLYQFFDDFACSGGHCQQWNEGITQSAAKPSHPAIRCALRYGKIRDSPPFDVLSWWWNDKHDRECGMAMDDKTRTELEAAVFRRLIEHLRSRTDVQNIDLMNMAGFCRNCLSNWMKEEADATGVAFSRDESREAVYGMPYETWREKFQGTASPEQLAAMSKVSSGH